jgi:hypothetical protein
MLAAAPGAVILKLRGRENLDLAEFRFFFFGEQHYDQCDIAGSGGGQHLVGDADITIDGQERADRGGSFLCFGFRRTS